MRNISGQDTLFRTADTLLSINNKETDTRIIYAYHNTKFYRKELQGKCDSLVYNRSDSTIYLYTDPVIWNKDSQMSADSINIQLANDKIRTMYMKVNSFVISEDSLHHFNQLKGKDMDAHFRDNQIKKVNVRGNGQNIYFVLEGDSVLIGMNRVECSDMDIHFKEENKIHKISYINKVDAVMVPPHEIEEPQTKLKDFQWRIQEKPTKEQLLEKRVLVAKKEEKNE